MYQRSAGDSVLLSAVRHAARYRELKRKTTGSFVPKSSRLHRHPSYLMMSMMCPSVPVQTSLSRERNLCSAMADASHYPVDAKEKRNEWTGSNLHELKWPDISFPRLISEYTLSEETGRESCEEGHFTVVWRAYSRTKLASAENAIRAQE